MAAKPARSETDFSIKVDFQKDQGDPTRVFRFLTDVIEALKETDKALIRSINGRVEPSILLEDVDGGSIRVWLRQAVDSLDDEGLKKGEYKIIIGKYLVKAKYLIVDFLKDKTELKGLEEVEELERDLLLLAKETDVTSMPFYQPVSRPKLLRGIEKINSSLRVLDSEDEAVFNSGNDEIEFNLSLNIAPQTILQLVTAETRTFPALEVLLKVKKADFLGESQWDFRHGTDSYTAKFVDEGIQWLEEYQSGRVVVLPGYALRVMLVSEVQYDTNQEVIAKHHFITKVLDVKEGYNDPNISQGDLFGNR